MEWVTAEDKVKTDIVSLNLSTKNKELLEVKLHTFLTSELEDEWSVSWTLVEGKDKVVPLLN
jgi:hypothetical protein